MHCLKTGIVVHILSTDEYTNVDLFSNGFDLFINKGTKSKKAYRTVECTVTSTDDLGKYEKLVNPQFEESVIEYVEAMKFKTPYEEKFISKFKKKDD